MRSRALELLRSGRASLLDKRRRRAIMRARPASRSTPHVFYGHEHVPGPEELAYGGLVKFQGLQSRYPNAPRDFNLVYLGSSSLPRDAVQLVALARDRGAPLVWNQNGVAYPAWAGDRTEAINAPYRICLRDARHVFYQSEFCKRSADAALGEPTCPWEVLYNPVDTRRFAPTPLPKPGFVILLGGNQYEWYRLESALRTLELVARRRPESRLLVTGRLSWTPDHAANRAEALALAAELGMGDRVELLGEYTQADAAAVLCQAHLLLHTKVNDPCPTVVLEAMACGLPVVYSASGGVPELVDETSGIGVETPVAWNEIAPPAPEAFAAAVLEAGERLDELGGGRARAVERFELARWVARHEEVFGSLLSGR